MLTGAGVVHHPSSTKTPATQSPKARLETDAGHSAAKGGATVGRTVPHGVVQQQLPVHSGRGSRRGHRRLSGEAVAVIDPPEDDSETAAPGASSGRAPVSAATGSVEVETAGSLAASAALVVCATVLGGVVARAEVAEDSAFDFSACLFAATRASGIGLGSTSGCLPPAPLWHLLAKEARRCGRLWAFISQRHKSVGKNAVTLAIILVAEASSRRLSGLLFNSHAAWQ